MPPSRAYPQTLLPTFPSSNSTLQPIPHPLSRSPPKIMITDRITLSTPPTSLPLDPEDYLSTSLGVIFPDDITNQHGDPSTPVIYTSPRFGSVVLTLPEPVGEGSRRLFAQYLWNAGVQVAVGIEDAGWVARGEDGESEGGGGRYDGVEERMDDVEPRGRGDGRAITTRTRKGEKDAWDVRDETVLELGAGTGIAGIIAVKAGAREVVITDYPAEEVLANLRLNVERNLTVEERKRCCVKGHEWGVVPGFDDAGELHSSESDVDSGAEKAQRGNALLLEGVSSEGQDAVQVLDEYASTETDRETFPASHAHYFTRIILADCLWMPSQHVNLHRSIAHFLSPDGYAIVVAGFHTGRAKMAPFFDVEALRMVGLKVESIVERDAVRRERVWKVEELGDAGQGREDLSERKRWLVVALLKRIGRAGEGGEK